MRKIHFTSIGTKKFTETLKQINDWKITFKIEDKDIISIESKDDGHLNYIIVYYWAEDV